MIQEDAVWIFVKRAFNLEHDSFQPQASRPITTVEDIFDITLV